ncbi:MAG: peptidase m23 [Candidatus Berkelbacteria bacterium Licking1014_7]|uniref:Peptidase m23 n=1 Tax=Candidatus Berkelbacteria bacterium Licking1014_7 TaxID=2017147 RepID=A0A554LIP2_9BACT|nr:MAG: peptidase m23 [Candidatus Berkelbacteria bacterium Licking1014_7]
MIITSFSEDAKRYLIGFRKKILFYQKNIIKKGRLFGNKKQKMVLSRTFSVLIIGIFVWLSNTISAQANNQDQFLWLNFNTQNLENIISTVDKYTTTIDENNAELVKVVKGEEDGFLTKPTIDEDLKKEYKYTVQKGDTIIEIARKFDITVASIQSANGLKAMELEQIQPGATLIIPPYSTDESVAWLDEINTEKTRIAQEQAKKQAEAKAKLARQKRTVAYRDQSSSRETTNLGYSGESSGGFMIPIRHNGITRGITRGHTGIDYRADVGTPVQAAGAGKVVEITTGWGRGWGNSVVIDHGGGLTTRYAHLSSFASGLGSTLAQGQILGYSGNSGFTTGAHLHFEARRNGSVISPF